MNDPNKDPDYPYWEQGPTKHDPNKEFEETLIRSMDEALTMSREESIEKLASREELDIRWLVFLFFMDALYRESEREWQDKRYFRAISKKFLLYGIFYPVMAFGVLIRNIRGQRWEN